MRAQLAITVTLLGFLLAAGNGGTESLRDGPTPACSQPRGAITLRDALAMALVGNQELSAAGIGVRVEEARAVQAGLLPNPELRANVDNFGGSGSNQAFNASESSLRLTQLVELGGKRARRQELAGLERDAATWDFEARRATVLAETAKAFVDTLTLQERSTLAAQSVHLAATSASAVEMQVHAGASSRAEALRARVAVSQSESDQSTRDRELAAARTALAALWGSAAPTFDRAAGDLQAIEPPPSLDALLSDVQRNPDLARWTTELAVRDASIALEESRAIPDVTVGAGPSYYADAGGAGWVVDLQVPLPLFNRNQGAIAAARAERLRANAERRASDTAVRAALARNYEAARTAYEYAGRLRDDMLPNAQAAYASTQEAYRAGALRALDVLDAQRTLFGLRDQYLAALGTYHKTIIDLDRLAGATVDPDHISIGSRP